MKTIIKNKFILFTSLLLITASCSPVSSSWSCKNGLKGSCKTIKEIDTGYIDNNKNDSKSVNLKEKINQKSNNNISSTEDSSFNDFRSKESVARVKFSPYVDEAGNRHDSSVVYYLEQKAEWRK